VYQSYWDQVSREKTLMHDKYIERLAKGKAETLTQMIKRKFNKFLSKEDEIYVVAKIQQASASSILNLGVVAWIAFRFKLFLRQKAQD
jgi:hypothetical protein